MRRTTSRSASAACRPTRDVSVAVGEREIVGVIGPNGAGKTTLFNMITGFYTPDTGRILYRGRDITKLPVHERAALGLGRTFQNVGLVKGATVRENLVTAQYLQAGYGTIAGMFGSRRSLAGERRLRRKAEALAEVLGLDRPARHAGGRSAVRHAQAGRDRDRARHRPRPPAAGRTVVGHGTRGGPASSATRCSELRDMFNLSIAMIEHHVPLVVRVCDHVYCLDFGQLVTDGPPHDVRNHPQVVAAYLGEDPDPAAVALEAQLDDLVEDD